MNDSHVSPFDEQVVRDPARNWAIHACEHGCVHVSLGSVTLTLAADEFAALMVLMWRARAQMLPAPPPPESAYRPN
jgi:hypothetical protein